MGHQPDHVAALTADTGYFVDRPVRIVDIAQDDPVLVPQPGERPGVAGVVALEVVDRHRQLGAHRRRGFHPQHRRLTQELQAGVAKKGNTLLNYAGVGTDLIPYVVDNNPSKQGSYLPGSRIPIVDERHLVEDRPDFVLVLPWGLRYEITQRLGSLDGWSGSVVTTVSQLAIK